MRSLVGCLAVAAMALGASGCGSKEEEPVTYPERLAQPEPEREKAAQKEQRAEKNKGGGAGKATPTKAGQSAQAEVPSTAGETPPGEDPRSPDTFTVRLDTTKGPVDIEVHRAWAPRGADRFYALVKGGYYSDVAFFRVISGFMAQTGISGDPALNRQWRARRIADDPPAGKSNTRGMVSYAMAGPGSRTTQFFINLVNNSNLDGMGFTPFGKVKQMATVDRLYAGYGEGAPSGRGPAQNRIQSEGNRYLRAEFPELDYIRSASVLE